MTTSSWNRARRVAAAASVLTVLAVVAGAVILALGVGVPDGWWPHTGQAFATSTASAGGQDVTGAAWMLGTAGAGVAALVVWRPRSAAGQRRR